MNCIPKMRVINMEITMTYAKSTKNKHVYEASGQAVPSVYIEKSAFSGAPPTQITLTLDLS